MLRALMPFAVVLSFATVAGLAALRAEAAGNPCTGAGRTGETIICSGTCDPGTCGDPIARPVGEETAVFCGCLEGQLGWNCCYLLQYTSGPHNGEYFVLGDCVSCPEPGDCERGGEGTLAKPFVAKCE